MNNPATSEEEKRWIWLQLPVCSPVSCTEDNWCDLCEHTVSRLLAWKDQEVAKAKLDGTLGVVTILESSGMSLNIAQFACVQKYIVSQLTPTKEEEK